MLDIKIIRKDKEGIEKKLRTKDPESSLDEIIQLDQEIRNGKLKVETLKASRNEASTKIGELKRQGQDIAAITAKMKAESDEIQSLDQQLSLLESKFHAEMSKLPNIPFDEIPVSPDPKDNVMVKEWGSKPSFNIQKPRGIK
jgi:seryl-tRNA synthetase